MLCLATHGTVSLVELPVVGVDAIKHRLELCLGLVPHSNIANELVRVPGRQPDLVREAKHIVDGLEEIEEVCDLAFDLRGRLCLSICCSS